MKKLFALLLALTMMLSVSMVSAETLECDVVVVGGGGAGMSAALSAAENGAKVILIEKQGYLGGATMMSGGIVPAVGTKQQKEAGIEDNLEWFVRDIERPSNYAVREDLVYTVAENAKTVIEWLEGMGVKWTVMNSLFYGQSNYRMHLAEGSGKGLSDCMIATLENNDNITLMLNTPGTGLMTNDAGEVIGVTAQGADGEMQILAKNTILCTSGFAANQEMVAKYMPEMSVAQPYYAPGATGEGIQWGMELGAAVANMGAYQGHAFYGVGYGSTDQGIANNGGIFINQNGVRFTNEYGGYSELTPHVLHQPGHYCYMVFNDAIAAKSAKFEKFKEAGIVFSGDTAEELAAQLNIDSAKFAQTITEYQASIVRGEDEFNRTKLPESFETPYYAIKITGDLRHTQGGLVTDIATHVMKEDGTLIPGLYAAGGVMEGFSSTGGPGYMSGNGLLQAFIFGKIAGERAATEVRGEATVVNYEFPVDELAVAEEAALQTMGGADVKFVDGEYNGLGQGHGGDITVKVVIADTKIASIEVVSQNETPAIYASCEKTMLDAITAANGTAVDTVSGATESSVGIINAVNSALLVALNSHTGSK